MLNHNCTCVYANSENTESVRKGFEMGGYIKTFCEACSTVQKETNSQKAIKIQTASDNVVIEQALIIIKRRLRKPGAVLDSAESVAQFAVLTYAELDVEVFGALFLDQKFRLISHERLFCGTTAHVSVYPREVARHALKLNASRVVLIHNHPSGIANPSADDIRVTNKLKITLELIDVSVVDHIIVAGVNTFSFSERGLL